MSGKGQGMGPHDIHPEVLRVRRRSFSYPCPYADCSWHARVVDLMQGREKTRARETKRP